MSKDRETMGRTGVIVAARCGSLRLPGKVLMPLGGKPMILFLLDRIKSAREIDAIVLATTHRADDDELAELVAAAGLPVFRGAEEDVVRRYVDAAEAHELDYVVRVTGDCPFVDAASLDFCLRSLRSQVPFDLATTKGLFPVGIDYEVYRAAAMRALHEGGSLSDEDREHLTLYFYKHRVRFRIVDLQPPEAWRAGGTFTVDTAADYERAERIVEEVGGNAGIAEVVSCAP